MLNQQTVEKLHGMKLQGIADAFREQLETTQNGQLSFEERFALLVDQQWLWKENRALARPPANRQAEGTRRNGRHRLFTSVHSHRRNTPDDIGLLNDKDLPTLVGLLCEGEARGRGLSASLARALRN